MTESVTMLNQIRAAYADNAQWHDRFTRAITLGLEPYLRRQIVAKLALRPGDKVVDVACGTGLNFAALEAAIGPAGWITGLDLSAAMLTEARKKVTTQGWQNVQLVETNAMILPLADSADAVLCTLAIGLMPDPNLVVERMLKTVRPGGQVLIADGQLVNGWPGRFVNPLLRRVAAPWVPAAIAERYWHTRAWETLQDNTDEFCRENWLGGIVYVAWGQRPRPSAVLASNKS